jgi:hypothetical protein
MGGEEWKSLLLLEHLDDGVHDVIWDAIALIASNASAEEIAWIKADAVVALAE